MSELEDRWRMSLATILTVSRFAHCHSGIRACIARRRCAREAFCRVRVRRARRRLRASRRAAARSRSCLRRSRSRTSRSSRSWRTAWRASHVHPVGNARRCSRFLAARCRASRLRATRPAGKHRDPDRLERRALCVQLLRRYVGAGRAAVGGRVRVLRRGESVARLRGTRHARRTRAPHRRRLRARDARLPGLARARRARSRRSILRRRARAQPRVARSRVLAAARFGDRFARALLLAVGPREHSDRLHDARRLPRTGVLRLSLARAQPARVWQRWNTWSARGCAATYFCRRASSCAAATGHGRRARSRLSACSSRSPASDCCTIFRC